MKLCSAIAVLAVLSAGCAATQTQQTQAPTGTQTFERHCAACHGTSARGDGPVASEMRIAVPDLTALSRRNGGTFPADRVASYIDGRNLPAAHGDRIMPVWGRVFDATARLVEGAEGAGPRIDELVAYLRGLQRP